MAEDDRSKMVGLFRPVVSGRISEMIADQIRSLIRSGELRPGDRLPAERDLCQQFGVSRVTVRDALRLLEGTGLISTRVGARGGATVKAPTGSNIGEGLLDMVSLAALGADEVTEARLVLEMGIVPLVCERATEADIAELRAICEEGDQALANGHYDVSHSADFHIRFARAAHNRALDVLIESFNGPLRQSLGQAQAVAPTMGRRGTREHWALVDAVGVKDVATARTIMEQHLERTLHRVQAASSGRRRRSAAGASKAGGPVTGEVGVVEDGAMPAESAH